MKNSSNVGTRDNATNANTNRTRRREPRIRLLRSKTSLTRLRTTRKTSSAKRMTFTLINRKKAILLPKEYSGAVSGIRTSKNANANTIKVVARITKPSRLRRLASSSLRFTSIGSAVLEFSMSSFLRGEKDSQILPSKKIKDKLRDDDDKDAVGELEIECDSLPLDGDISRHIPQPGHLTGRRKDQSKHDQDDSHIDQRPTQSGHLYNSLLACQLGVTK